MRRTQGKTDTKRMHHTVGQTHGEGAPQGKRKRERLRYREGERERDSDRKKR